MKKIIALLSASILIYSNVYAEWSNNCSCHNENELYAKVWGGANFLQSSTSGGVGQNIKQDMLYLVRLDILGAMDYD